MISLQSRKSGHWRRGQNKIENKPIESKTTIQTRGKEKREEINGGTKVGFLSGLRDAMSENGMESSD